MDLTDLTGWAHLLEQAVQHYGKTRKAFYSLNGHGHRHEADAADYVVTDVSMGIDGSNVWFQARFTDATNNHTLRAEQPDVGFGKRKTATVLTLDDKPQVNSNFIVSHREGLEGDHIYERALAIFEFDDGDGQRQVYRFDIDLATIP